MDAKNSQNTRLAEKKGGCRIPTMRWVWLLGHTSSTHWNLPWPLLHAMQPLQTKPMNRNHLGQCTALF